MQASRTQNSWHNQDASFVCPVVQAPLSNDSYDIDRWGCDATSTDSGDSLENLAPMIEEVDSESKFVCVTQNPSDSRHSNPVSAVNEMMLSYETHLQQQLATSQEFMQQPQYPDMIIEDESVG